MGKLYDEIDDRLRDFIHRQHVFFVATAPSGHGGYINLSPKGVSGALAVLAQQESRIRTRMYANHR